MISLGIEKTVGIALQGMAGVEKRTVIQTLQASVDDLLLVCVDMAVGYELGEGILLLVVVGNGDGGRRGMNLTLTLTLL